MRLSKKGVYKLWEISIQQKMLLKFLMELDMNMLVEKAIVNMIRLR